MMANKSFYYSNLFVYQMLLKDKSKREKGKNPTHLKQNKS